MLRKKHITNHSQNKKTYSDLKKRSNIFKILFCLVILIVLCLSIGYSSFTSKLAFNDISAEVRAKSDIRITDISVTSSEGNAISNYEEYNVDSISSEIYLPNNNSSVTYKISVTNFESEEMVLFNITGLPDNLKYEFTNDNYTLKEKICDAEGNCNLGITKDIYLTIKYDGFDESNKLYSINLNFMFVIESAIVATFNYTEEEERFTSLYDGIYKLEVWGAQGGTAYSDVYRGGYGGYSTGTIELTIGEELFVNVGGQGESGTINVTKHGGYNGGGSVAASTDNSTNRYVAGGGGATHIAIVSGLLVDLSDNVDSLLIVAGGGGGGYKHTSTGYYGVGGDAGGFQGEDGNYGTGGGNYYGTGGTQTDPGYAYGKSTSGVGAFGLGGSLTTKSHGSAGGGGYYGGGASYGDIRASGNSSGGGGSGYIGNSRLIDKYMVCYECRISDEVATKTITTDCSDEEPISDYAKIGNGYAKITLIEIFDN